MIQSLNHRVSQCTATCNRRSFGTLPLSIDVCVCKLLSVSSHSYSQVWHYHENVTILTTENSGKRDESVRTIRLMYMNVNDCGQIQVAMSWLFMALDLITLVQTFTITDSTMECDPWKYKTLQCSLGVSKGRTTILIRVPTSSSVSCTSAFTPFALTLS